MTIASGPSNSLQIWREQWYPHLVIELDYRFLPGAAGNDHWSLYYRTVGSGERYGGHVYQFHENGDVEASLEGVDDPKFRVRLPGAALSGRVTNHVLLIAKGQELALYLNDQPVFYKVEEPMFLNGGVLFSMYEGQVAIDNFKLWKLSGE